MDWIKKINDELEQKKETASLVSENLESVIDEFFKIAESKAREINEEINQEDLLDHGFRCHVYQLENHSGFYVGVDSKSVDDRAIRMEVFFSSNNAGRENTITDNDFIRVERVIVSSLPEIIAVRFDRGLKEITFEPKFYDGQGETSQIGQETLKRLLVEPAIREYLRLPQESYLEGFGR